MSTEHQYLSKEQIKVISLSSFGGMLEYFDFVIYGFYAHIIGEVFFNSSSLLVNQLQGFSIFALGYIARPIGGFIFSHIGDTHSRKKSFLFTIFLMACSTFFIGFLPTYSQIGILAPILLVALRFVQGFAVGGELPASITYVFEHVPEQKRGFACGLLYFGVIGGIVLASITSTLTFHFFPRETILDWGWRIPFIFGGILGVIGLILRKNLVESPIFVNIFLAKKTLKYPVLEIFKNYKMNLLSGVFITAFSAIVTSLAFYIPSYLHAYYGYNESQVLFMNTLSVIIQCFSIVVMGKLSDYTTRKTMATIATILFFFLTPFLFYLLGTNNGTILWSTSIFLGIISGCIVGCIASLLAELFPTNIRFSGISGSLNLATAFFAGPAPLIFDFSIKFSQNNLLPGFIVSLFALIAFLFIRNMQPNSKFL
nr:MFS transporter [Pigmentibacter ruber]